VAARLRRFVPAPANGIVELITNILLFKKPGESTKVDRAVKDESALTKDERENHFVGSPLVEHVKSGTHDVSPEEPRCLIRMFAGETVLDSSPWQRHCSLRLHLT